MATRREREEFERRVREVEAAGLGDVREELAIATGLAEGCTDGAPDVTLAEALDARPSLAERVRAMNDPRIRLVEGEMPATVLFVGRAVEESAEPAD